MFDADAPAPEPVELDGWGPANIFDLEDVFDFADVGPDVEVFDEADIEDEVKAAGDDGYAPDPAMPPAGGAVLRYDGRDYLPDGVPTRAELVAAQDLRDLLGSRTPEGKSTSTKLREKLAAGAPVFFMPSDIEETNDYSDGAPEYVIRAFGALMDGSKAEVVITGVDVFFDVPVPERPPAAALLSGKAAARLEALDPLAARLAGFDGQLREVLAAAGAAGCRIADVTAFPARGYHAAPKPYKRIRTATLQQRKKAIAAVHAADLETASDDRSCYYRKAAREGGLPLSDWAILSKYDYSPGPTERSPLCGHVFRVAAAGYRPLVDQLAPKAEREKTGAVRAANPLLARDRTLVWTWDIETHRGDDTGELPDGERDDDVVFMICGTAHWKDDPTPLAEIGIVDVETAPTVGRTTLVCGSQANVLKAFALVWGALAPDINIGFNDSGYDWPFVVEKARKLGLLAWMWNAMSAAPRKRLLDEDVLKWNVRRDQKIKISPEEVYYSTYLKVPGCVPIDIRACYKKLFPKSETPKAGSLKFYLEISGLSGKVDMPIKRLWRYYEAARETEGEPDAAAAEHMREGLHYCNEDGRRCQQLQVRRNVINDYREVASLAFVSMYDSHYYAGGMKVCNLLGAHAWRRGMLASFLAREREEAGKYPGAFVFPPEKGLTPDPARLAALDTAAAELRSARDAALAASMVACERLLATTISDATGQDIRTKTASAAAAAEAICKQAPGSPAALRLEAARAAVVAALQAFAPDRPVTGLDFSSLYPSIIMTYNLSPEKILLTQADADYWAAQGKTLHKIEFPFNGRAVVGWSIMHNNVPEDIGLFPTVLIDLFNRRAEVKVVLGKHGAVKELIESITGRAKKDGVSAAEALRRVRAEAEAEAARTAAALAPGAPPPRISPGATLGEELAELKRLSKNAAEQVAGIRRICEGAEKRAPGSTAPDDAIMAELAAVYEKTCFDYVCANSKQNALKVYMNSFYGESGNSLSPFFLLPLAGGVTSAGQANIKAVADFVEGRETQKKTECAAVAVIEQTMAKQPECTVKHGDSVTGDTALVIRTNGVIGTVRFDELVPDGAWQPYREDKEAAVIAGLEVWQDGGFTAVNRIIRHMHEGPIVRILTHTGLVDCTTDHSLLRRDGLRATPEEIVLDDELLHADDQPLVNELGGDDTVISTEEAWAMGMFASEGCAGVYKQSNGGKLYHWSITNQDHDTLVRAKAGLPFTTGISGKCARNGCYKLEAQVDRKTPCLRYCAQFYNEHREKKIPDFILNADFDVALAFWEGFYEGDGNKCPGRKLQLGFGQKGKEMCTGLWMLGRRLGWDLSMSTRENKPNVFQFYLCDEGRLRRPRYAVKKIIPRPDEDETKGAAHVYDLETASGHFHVGPGALVVHNTDEPKSGAETALVVIEEKKAERPVFRIKYGDTDSLYLQAPNKCFEECDADYVEGRVSREEWWSAMVRITMRALNQIRDEVNAFLRADNGSPYLKMAYEEVLYPVGFTGKKKYFGIPHLNEVNFHPKKLFIRGIDVVKQGQPKMAVDIGYRIMWAGMAINNTRDMRGIVEDVLRDAVVNGAQWSFKDFVKTDAWKPHKNNIPVHRCIARMQARHDAEVAENDRRAAAGAAPRPLLYEMPESGERFSYVIVKTGAAFDLRGCKQEPKKGDRMVFAAAARALGLEVDVAFYMISYVVGLCARFINGDAAFQPPAATLRLLTEKKVDEVSQKNAKKVLTAFLKSLGGVSATVSRNRGYAYRRAFKSAATSCRSSLAGAVGELAAEVLHGDWLSYEFFLGDGGGGDGSDDEGTGGDRATEAVGAIWAAAGSFVDGIAAARGVAWCTERAQLAGIAANGANQVATPAPAKAAAPPVPTKAAAPAPGVAAAAPGAKPSKAAAKPKPAIIPATNLFRAGAPRRRPTISAAAVAAANALTRIETAARDKLAALLPAITRIAGRYEIGLSQLVHHSRAAEHRLHPELGEGQDSGAAETLPAAVTLTDSDRVVLLDFRDAWFECIGVQLTRRWDTLYADHLRRLKDKRTGAVVAPPKADRARAIAAAAQKLAPIGGVVVHM